MQLSTTKRFSRPSDNPVDFTQALNLREILTAERRYVRNIERGVNLLNLNDSVLGGVNDIIQRAREIALSGASDSLDDAARQALAYEVDELIDQALQLANSRSGEIFIFSGNLSDRSPFATASYGAVRSVRYLGDQGTRLFEVGQGNTVAVLLNGVEAFLGSQGITRATRAVTDSTALLNVELAGQVPPVTSGTFEINGQTITVDVTTDSLETIRNKINRAYADAEATIDDQGRLVLKSLHAFDVVLKDGTSNILQTLGLHQRIQSGSLGAPGSVTDATTLAALGITPGGLRIQAGDLIGEINLSGAVTVADMLSIINTSGLPLNAFINADGSGIEISATESIDRLEITEISRIFGAAIGGPGLNEGTLLSSLGITLPLGSIEITNGAQSFQIDLSSAATISEVLHLINRSEAGVTAVVNAAGTGIDIVNKNDVIGIQVTEVGAGTTAAELGILGSDLVDTASDLRLLGSGSMDREESANLFKALFQLSEGLRQPQQKKGLVSKALENLDVAFTLNNGNRAAIGARTNRLELALNRFTDSDLFLSQLISENEDIDLAKTVTDLRTQETVLQASLNSGARLLLPSLLDFLPI